MLRSLLEMAFPDRKQERLLCDLLRPGVRATIYKLARGANRPVDDIVYDDAEDWLRCWIKNHKHDYQREFYRATVEFVSQRLGIESESR